MNIDEKFVNQILMNEFSTFNKDIMIKLYFFQNINLKNSQIIGV